MLIVDGLAVTFGTARKGLGGLRPATEALFSLVRPSFGPVSLVFRSLCKNSERISMKFAGGE